MSQVEDNLAGNAEQLSESLTPHWIDDDTRFLHAKVQPSGRVDIKEKCKYSFGQIERDRNKPRIYISRKTAKPGHGKAKSTEHPYRGYRITFETIKAMQAVRKIENIFYLVMTLPGSTRNAQYAAECWSGEIVELFGNFIRKEISLPEYVWAYEYQKRNFLHLNVVMYVPKYLQGKMTKDFMHHHLRKLLLLVSEKAKYDLFERDDGLSYKNEERYPIISFEPCKKDLAHYVAKTDTKVPRKDSETGFLVSPCRWYGCTKAASFLREINTSEFEFDWEEDKTSSLLKSFEKKGKPKSIVNPFNQQMVGKTAQAKNKRSAEKSLAKLVSTTAKVNREGLLAISYINSSRILESRDRILETWHHYCICRLFPSSLNQFSKAAKADKRTVEKVLRYAGLWNMWLKKNKTAIS